MPVHGEEDARHAVDIDGGEHHLGEGLDLLERRPEGEVLGDVDGGDLGFDRCVVLEFPSVQDVRKFYDSPEYAPLLKLRRETTVSHVVIVEGFSGA